MLTPGSGPPSPAPVTIVSGLSTIRTLIQPRLRMYLLKPVSKYVRTAPTYALCTSAATDAAWRCKNAYSGRYLRNIDVSSMLRFVDMLVRIGMRSDRKCVRSLVAAYRTLQKQEYWIVKKTYHYSKTFSNLCEVSRSFDTPADFQRLESSLELAYSFNPWVSNWGIKYECRQRRGYRQVSQQV